MGKENFDAIAAETTGNDPVMDSLVNQLEETTKQLLQLRSDTRFTPVQKEGLIADLKKEHADLSEKITQVMIENAQKSSAKVAEDVEYDYPYEGKYRPGPTLSERPKGE